MSEFVTTAAPFCDKLPAIAPFLSQAPKYVNAANLVTNRFNAYMCAYKKRKSEHDIALMVMLDIALQKNSDDQKPEMIRIKVYGAQVEYVRALPIHESQKEIETTSEWSIFEYRLVPCYNFYQQLLWHREKLEVIEPLAVREELKSTMQKMLGLYQ